MRRFKSIILFLLILFSSFTFFQCDNSASTVSESSFTGTYPEWYQKENWDESVFIRYVDSSGSQEERENLGTFSYTYSLGSSLFDISKSSYFIFTKIYEGTITKIETSGDSIFKLNIFGEASINGEKKIASAEVSYTPVDSNNATINGEGIILESSGTNTYKEVGKVIILGNAKVKY